MKETRSPSRIRSIAAMQEMSLREAIWPVHQRRPKRVENIHETDEKKRVVDPYHWMKTMNEQEKLTFERQENEWYQMCLIRFDSLYRQLLREHEFYEHIPKVLPLKIGDYIYYRRIENQADSISLYRFPVDEL